MTKTMIAVPYTVGEKAHVSEDGALSASPIACAVADAWADRLRDLGPPRVQTKLLAALTAFELATRESPLRKVKP